MKKHNFLLISGTLLIVLGLWIALIPFSRPLPGGEAFSFESTPEASCKSPIFGAFNDDFPSYEVFTTPKPKVGDITVTRSINCSDRATFRLALGFSFFLLGISTIVYFRKIKDEND